MRGMLQEHFGIVPLEAMAHSRPVIACNSGGPRESVQHGLTGFLCAPTPRAFAEAMQRVTVRPCSLRLMMNDCMAELLAKASAEHSITRDVFTCDCCTG